MQQCQHCGAPIEQYTRICPHCGRSRFEPPTPPKKTFIMVIQNFSLLHNFFNYCRYSEYWFFSNAIYEYRHKL
ncbi:zinc-ribbon domain-containing protein [Staphylococcus agnetis]|uniref:zinc-ribbon domain-containing protein n=1 Tax=Staphylococcus agnetis TaxID=985762 RepID=UPI003988C447